MMQLTGYALALGLCVAICGMAHAGCGDAEEACEVASGEYHITVPASEAPVPAVIFLHGAGGKGVSATRMKTITERGYAAIGPQGKKRPGSRFGASWAFHPDRAQFRDEPAFIREVIADAVANHNVDPDRIMIGGFSIGGSMTSYLACADPTLARAFAPVAGGFWRPHPEITGCAGPVNLLHTHGWKDKTVPLEGRPLGGGRIFQGDIWVTMQIWRETNGCTGMRADSFDINDNFWVRKWDTCKTGALEFALHQGAHGIPRGWATMAIDWFESLDGGT